jgi:hypothetical protein
MSNKQTHGDHSGDFAIRADFSLATSPIEYRLTGEVAWRPTGYQVADAESDAEKALLMVSTWLDTQS